MIKQLHKLNNFGLTKAFDTFEKKYGLKIKRTYINELRVFLIENNMLNFYIDAVKSETKENKFRGHNSKHISSIGLLQDIFLWKEEQAYDYEDELMTPFYKKKNRKIWKNLFIEWRKYLSKIVDEENQNNKIDTDGIVTQVQKG